MSKHKGKAEIDIATAAVTMIKANIMAYVVTAIFILFSSIILTYTNASPNFEDIIVIIGIIASAFIAGYDTAKMDNRNGYKWGAIGGMLYFVIFLILGTIIEKLNNISLTKVFMIAVLIVVTSMIAGMISVNSTPRSNKRY